ncbi:MAG: hypothetical protein M1587_11400 [Thaumarchaeota archaeon]|nr:hypothetical protein [Nitrososphaerota archaeon]
MKSLDVVLVVLVIILVALGSFYASFMLYPTVSVSTTTLTEKSYSTTTVTAPTVTSRETVRETSTFTTSVTVNRTVTETSPTPTFSLNQTLALSFYSKLAVQTGGGALLQVFPGSQTIYLADDQALDYYALESISNSTGSPAASSEAQGINASISAWGGLYKYWNPIFVTVGDYPSNWAIENGVDKQIGSIVSDGQNYSVMATLFSPNPNFDYYNYSDVDLEVSLWNLHVGNYTAAENAFVSAQNFWTGYGFADQAFSNGLYASYKLALDLIAWKSLEANPSTSAFANNYASGMRNVASIMSLLQNTDGGVWTNYKIDNGQLEFGSGVSLENGETTSLFVIAANTK